MSILRDRIFEGLLIIGEESEGAYGYFPDKRPINLLMKYGFIPLDKPAGQQSHQVVFWVKKILGVESAGHSGTLDPLATGLLPIAINDATKALTTLLLGPKEYLTVMRLHSPVAQEELEYVVSEFTGEIYQKPPQRSSVRKVTRIRKIYQIEIMERKGNLVLLRVLCQAGTYVRKLIYDIGEVLGVGATMIELRRTRVCNIEERQGLVRLHDLALAAKVFKEEGREEGLRENIWPIEAALSHLKAIVAKDSAVDSVCHGAALAVPGVARASKDIAKGDTVAIYTQKAEIVAIGECLMDIDELKEADKGLVVKPSRVIMPAGTYPKQWGSSD
ncbi:MAG: RNA-guided pseudouridylation complex pseudouridine synthase subunit Cbf5 [Conexivisphaerales archaeon]